MLSARRRAEEFAAAVDGRPGSGASSEMRVFIDLVEQLRAVPSPDLRPAFSADLRERLLAAAPAELAKGTPGSTDRARAVTSSPRRRRATSAAAVGLIISGSGMGVAAASQSALPGDAIYPVKRGIERVELALTGSAADRGQELLEQASTRLTEVQGLAVSAPDDPTTSPLIVKTLDDFASQATDGADSLIAAYEDESSVQSIVELRDFTNTSVTRLEELSRTLPADVRDEVREAAQLLAELDALARETCPSCSERLPLYLSSGPVGSPTETRPVVDDTIQVARPAPPEPPALESTSDGRGDPEPSIELPVAGVPPAEPGGTDLPGDGPVGNDPDQQPAEQPPALDIPAGNEPSLEVSGTDAPRIDGPSPDGTDPEGPGPDGPAPDGPDLDTPDLDGPDPDGTDPQDPGPEGPDLDGTDPQGPGLDGPTPDGPDLDTPDLDAPDPDGTNPETPNLETPDLDGPDLGGTNPETPDLETPDLDGPDLGGTNPETPDPEAPLADEPSVDAPTITVDTSDPLDLTNRRSGALDPLDAGTTNDAPSLP
ncbi:MAG: hypothetical protein H0U28_07250 [Nocardioidaceae bacterium]|nr:hypothetical protein [Nocardioidaceae bacterium]